MIGAGTPETAYYPALHTLFERVGASLSPKVLALSQLSSTGAGSPDFGLFAANQMQKGDPRKGQMPERGVVDRLAFWRSAPQPGVVVDPQKEAQRLRENQALGRPINEGETAVIRRRRRGLFEGVL